MCTHPDVDGGGHQVPAVQRLQAPVSHPGGGVQVGRQRQPGVAAAGLRCHEIPCGTAQGAEGACAAAWGADKRGAAARHAQVGHRPGAAQMPGVCGLASGHMSAWLMRTIPGGAAVLPASRQLHGVDAAVQSICGTDGRTKRGASAQQQRHRQIRSSLAGAPRQGERRPRRGPASRGGPAVTPFARPPRPPCPQGHAAWARGASSRLRVRFLV